MSRLDSSAEAPLPLRRISQALGEWIGRLGEVWVEGQVAQFVQRPGVATHFLTLRDVDANISMQVTCHRSVLTAPLSEGARIVLRVRPDFYAERGTLSLRATEIRQVGLGELLAQIERLRVLLQAEGLFAPARKRRLPFLPHTVGLITGRASAAERDVVENARRRLPDVRFKIENVATQGTSAVVEIVEALRRLDANPQVEVIVIARGGGSVEDLLGFSNESLLRAVAICRTPVVSAIGHENDRPLLDLVADVAASTPTDAGKTVVPDLAEELRQLSEAGHRMRTAIRRRVDIEDELLTGLPDRLRGSVEALIGRGEQDCDRALGALRGALDQHLTAATAETDRLHALVVSLSPQAVLNRGYAVIFNDSGALQRSASGVEAGQPMHARLADGELELLVTKSRSSADA